MQQHLLSGPAWDGHHNGQRNWNITTRIKNVCSSLICHMFVYILTKKLSQCFCLFPSSQSVTAITQHQETSLWCRKENSHSKHTDRGLMTSQIVHICTCTVLHSTKKTQLIKCIFHWNETISDFRTEIEGFHIHGWLQSQSPLYTVLQVQIIQEDRDPKNTVKVANNVLHIIHFKFMLSFKMFSAIKVVTLWKTIRASTPGILLSKQNQKVKGRHLKTRRHWSTTWQNESQQFTVSQSLIINREQQGTKVTQSSWKYPSTSKTVLYTFRDFNQ